MAKIFVRPWNDDVGMDWFFFAFLTLLLLLLAYFWKQNSGETECERSLLQWVENTRKNFNWRHNEVFSGITNSSSDIKFIASLCQSALFSGKLYLEPLRIFQICLLEEKRFNEMRQTFLRIFTVRMGSLIVLSFLGRAYLHFSHRSLPSLCHFLDRILLILAIILTFLIYQLLSFKYPRSWLFFRELSIEGKNWTSALFIDEPNLLSEELLQTQMQTGIDLEKERRTFLKNYPKEKKFRQDILLRKFLEYVPAIELCFFMLPPFLILALPLWQAYF